MRTVGLIGGTSYHSTIDYYRDINQMVNEREGDRINPPLLLYNLNQRRINDLQDAGKWDEISETYYNVAVKLIGAGAEAILLCANTAHSIYKPLAEKISVPILHIADATAKEAQEKHIKSLGLIGTLYTMEKPFLKDRLQEKHGFTIRVPEKTERTELMRIIREELSIGVLKETSKRYVIGVLNQLKEQGAQGIILGCTEFPLLIHQTDYDLPLLDTTQLHCKLAVDFILNVP